MKIKRTPCSGYERTGAGIFTKSGPGISMDISNYANWRWNMTIWKVSAGRINIIGIQGREKPALRAPEEEKLQMCN
jgi:hypothetical protein